VSIYRIKYVKSSENTVEIEASSVNDAWKKIKSSDISDAIWSHEGVSTYKAEVTEEISKHIATNPKG
tara:strand:- start:239 stop:439 length:201 start_codon:yes stop_codon:yes gene_type:complete